ncbi:MAG: type II secretion system F family protein [Ignavibacteria bacterium]|nr:type II secretion system F family protein [Ignavibacteria bacterium]
MEYNNVQSTIDLKNVVEPRSRERVTERTRGGRSLVERIRPRRITEREKAEFCMQLAVMLQARISLHRALQVLARQATNPRMKEVIDTLGKEIQKGNSLSKGLALQPEIFDNLFIVTAEVGQESGRLAEVLSHLAHHLEKITSLRRKVVQALTYPSLVIAVAVFVVSFLLMFIVPMFGEMFKNFRMELPTSTKIILSLSTVCTEYGLYMIGILGLLLYSFRNTIKNPKVREKGEKVLFKLPFIGDVLLKNHVARFCRTLGTMLQSQVSLLDALEVTRRIISNAELREEIRHIMKHVKLGNAIADPVIESKLFPPMVSQMIAVGEETSELDAMLLKVADYYEKELDHKVETLSSVIEPVLILILGLIVAAILVSMYLPMFDLVNIVGTAQ